MKPIQEPTETAPAQDSALPTDKPKPERPLTLKQQRWIDAYIANGGNATEAAALAGYKADSRQSLGEIGAQNLKKLKPILADILDKHGLTLDRASEVTADALQATKQADGEAVPDHKIRLDAAGLVYRLRGAFREGATVNVNLNYGLGAIELDPEFDTIEIEADGE